MEQEGRRSRGIRLVGVVSVYRLHHVAFIVIFGTMAALPIGKLRENLNQSIGSLKRPTIL